MTTLMSWRSLVRTLISKGHLYFVFCFRVFVFFFC